MQSVHYNSTIISLLANGRIKHLLNPWHIIVDFDDEIIKIVKRNWYLIGKDEQILAFRYIRNITIDRHIFGADIHIKIIGGKVSAYSIPKKGAAEIRDVLLKYNKTKKGKGIIFS